MNKPLIDNRFQHVYCTNCMYWDRLFQYIKNGYTDKVAPIPCCVCYPCNPENGVKRLIRNKYKEGNNEVKHKR